MFEMETKFNYIVLPERHVVRLVSTQTIAVPVQPGADSGSGSVFFLMQTLHVQAQFLPVILCDATTV